MKKLAWYGMTLLAIGVSGYAFAYAFIPEVGAGYMKSKLFDIPVPALSHFIGGGIALLLGAFQFNSRLRIRYTHVHRWIGRIYIFAILFGGIGGLILSFQADGGLTGQLGFGLLAGAWLLSGGIAFFEIRRGNIQNHQNWMIRNYALTLAAVTLRIYLPLSMISGVDFLQAYQVIAWMCWVPNLIIAEWIIFRKRTLVSHVHDGI